MIDVSYGPQTQCKACGFYFPQGELEDHRREKCTVRNCNSDPAWVSADQERQQLYAMAETLPAAERRLLKLLAEDIFDVRLKQLREIACTTSYLQSLLGAGADQKS